jgi:diphthamide biosynthesis methyltransferase
MLYLVGLGLYSLDDLPQGALKAIKESDLVYIESYTSFHKTGTRTCKRFRQKRHAALHILIFLLLRIIIHT